MESTTKHARPSREALQDHLVAVEAMLVARHSTATIERRCAEQFGASGRTARRYIKAVRDRWAAEAATGPSRSELRDATRRTLNAAVALAFDRSDPRAAVAALRVLIDLDALAAERQREPVEVKVTREGSSEGIEELKAFLLGQRGARS